MCLLVWSLFIVQKKYIMQYTTTRVTVNDTPGEHQDLKIVLLLSYFIIYTFFFEAAKYIYLNN